VEVQYRISVGAIYLSSSLFKPLPIRYTLYISNRDINPGHIGAMHYFKAPLMGRRMGLYYLDSILRFTHWLILLMQLTIVMKRWLVPYDELGNHLQLIVNYLVALGNLRADLAGAKMREHRHEEEHACGVRRKDNHGDEAAEEGKPKHIAREEGDARDEGRDHSRGHAHSHLSKGLTASLKARAPVVVERMGEVQELVYKEVTERK